MDPAQIELKTLVKESGLSYPAFARKYGNRGGSYEARSVFLSDVLNKEIGNERLASVKNMISKYKEENQPKKDIFSYERPKQEEAAPQRVPDVPSQDNKEIIYLLREILYSIRDLRDLKGTSSMSLKKGDMFEARIPKDQLQNFRITSRGN